MDVLSQLRLTRCAAHCLKSPYWATDSALPRVSLTCVPRIPRRHPGSSLVSFSAFVPLHFTLRFSCGTPYAQHLRAYGFFIHFLPDFLPRTPLCYTTCMSEVLYRKYRPQTFADVVGQDAVVKTLEAQVKNGTAAHAYLFAGSRGTGKTSIARILARELGTTANDLYEIDAASKTSVDDIRELNESVSTLPFDSKYKVYILDEVHMLSKSASNAFLKTLEEPPEHVIFVLATTETGRIPETILSRCEVHTFKKPNQEALKKHVMEVAKKEGYTIAESSAELIALMGDGSFRDTLGTLQKVLSSSTGKSVSEEQVALVTGAPKGETVNALVAALAAQDAPAALAAVHAAVAENIDVAVLLKLLLQKMRAVLLIRFGSASLVKGDLNEEDFAFVSGLAADKNVSNVAIGSESIVALLNAYTATARAYIPSLPLELAVVEMCGKKVGKD